MASSARHHLAALALLASLGAVTAIATGCKFQVASRTKAADSLTALVPTTTAADGSVTGAFSAAAKGPQELAASASSDLAGSSVTFPPGTLAVDTQVTLQDGEELASGSAASQLGYSAGQLTDASKAAMIVPSPEQNPAAPFTVALQVSPSASLALADASANLVVLFQEVDYTKSGAATLGLMTPGQFTVSGDTVTFATAAFGIFQAAYAPAPVTLPKSVPISGPTLSKTQAADVLTIAYTTTTPALPANTTTVSISGTVAADTQTVTLYSDAACTTQLAQGAAATYQGTGLAVTVPANASTDVYGIASSPTATSSGCTKLVAVVTDTTPPGAPTVTVTPASPTNDPKPTWSWNTPTSASGAFQYKLDSSDFTSGATQTNATSYTPASALPDGAHTLYVEAKDLAGNWSTPGSAAVTVDTTPPAVTITSPAAAASYVLTPTLVVSGGCEAGETVSVTVNTPALSGATTCPAGGTFSVTLTMPSPLGRAQTLSTVTASETDAAGNTGTATQTFYAGLNPSGLQLWLDAGDPSTLVMAGGTLTSWIDKSAHTGTLAVGTTSSGAMVTVGTSTPAMLTLGGQAYLAMPVAANGPLDFAPSSTPQAFEAFVAFQGQGTSSGALLSRGESGNLEYEVGVSGADLAVTAFGTATTVPAVAFNGSYVSVATVLVQPTTGIEVFRNTESSSSLDTDTSAIGSQKTTDDFLIGAQRASSNTGAANPYSQSIGEVLLYSPPLTNDADRQAIAAYLKAKWGASP